MDMLDRISDPGKWPSIHNSENLEILNEFADEQFASGLLSGRLSSLLIYHQIVQEMCVHLVECCNFYIELQTYPLKYDNPIKPKAMAGQYVVALSKGLDFDGKQEFLESIEKFNSLRNEAVHELTRNELESTQTKLNSIKEKFDAIYDMYVKIENGFREWFHCLYKDTYIDIIPNP